VPQEIKISNFSPLKLNVGLLRFLLVAPVKAISTSNKAFKQKYLMF